MRATAPHGMSEFLRGDSGVGGSVRFFKNFFKPRTGLSVRSEKLPNLELDLRFRFEKVQFRFKVGPNSELNFFLLLFTVI